MSKTQRKAKGGRSSRPRDPARQEAKRGRYAEKPHEIPKKGWRDIFLRVKEQIAKDNVGIVAAGVAFYGFLALFPAIIATIMIYGLVFSPQSVQQHLEALTGFLPQQARELLGEQLTTIAGQAPDSLGWGVAISILVALWSANKGMKALFQGLNITYDEEDSRGFIKQNGLTLLFTLCAIMVVMISALLIVALPAAMENLGLPAIIRTIAAWARWPVLAVLILFSLAILYRYAPDREKPQWKWVSWGTAIATVLWLVGSGVFSFYVSNFGSYNKTYGSVAAVVILMLWFMLSSFIILLGAEINSEMEGQTKKDTTTGSEEPMGKRGAHHADYLGESP